MKTSVSLFVCIIAVIFSQKSSAQIPSISNQPTNQHVLLGTNATFSVTASGTAPLTYQWRQGGAAIPSATSSTLTITNSQPANAGFYDVVVANGSGSVTSQIARLIVYAKYWTGGGDGATWSDAANWNGSTLPTSTQDAYIGVSGNITNSGTVTIRSLYCQANLAVSGSLTVKGYSELMGAFSLLGGGTVNANGADSILNVRGGVSADGGSFFATEGGTLSAPGLTTYSAINVSNARYFQASGAGSVLNLPNLVWINGPANNFSFFIQALHGGKVKLPGVTNIVGTVAGANGSATEITSGGTVGTGSVIDLSGLLSFSDQAGNNATSSLNCNNGCQLLLSSLRVLQGPSVFVSAGSTLSLPLLHTYIPGVTSTRYLYSHGTGSILDIPTLGKISGTANSSSLLIQALHGGRINLQSVTNIVGTVPGASLNGATEITSAGTIGTGSLIDLSSLLSFSDAAGGSATSSINVNNECQILLPNLTVLQGPSVFVSGGSVLSLPSLKTHVPGVNSTRYLYANGIGSVLDIPNLSEIVGTANATSLLIQALHGGRINLQSVTNIVGTVPGASGNGVTEITSGGTLGTGSVIDLSNLLSFRDQAGGSATSSLTCNNGCAILAPKLQILQGPSVYVSGGSALSLPSLSSYIPGVNAARYIYVHGTGSSLEMPNLRQIVGSANATLLNIQALSGGFLNLSSVTNIQGNAPGGSAGTEVRSDGIGSIINLVGLQTFTGPNVASAATVLNGGRIFLSTNAVFSNVTLTQPLIGTPQPLPEGAVGLPYQVLLTGLGAKPFVWSIVSNSLPVGLTLNGTSGTIQGTPQSVGTNVFRLRLTDSNSVPVEANFSLVVNLPSAGFSLTQSMPNYVSPGTNTVFCQIAYPSGRQLSFLLFQPILPSGWTLLSSEGDGSPEAQGSDIVFTGGNLPNPLSFSYRVAITPGLDTPASLSGAVTYLMDGMVDVATIPPSPDPLGVVPAKRNDADFQAPPWVIDNTEVSWVLAYWRAQGYHSATNDRDGFAPGPGPVLGAYHTADFEAPFGVLDGTEANRVLCYWRAGAYHPDPEGADGYAPGSMGGEEIEIAALAHLGSESEISVTQFAADTFNGAAPFYVTNVVAYEGKLLSFLVRPEIPAGWKIESASGPGSPQSAGGEIILTGTIPPSPFELVFGLKAPPGTVRLAAFKTTIESQKDGSQNAKAEVLHPLIVGAAKLAISLSASGELQLEVQGQTGAVYQIQISFDLKHWKDVREVKVNAEEAHLQLPVAENSAFFRALLTQ